MKRAWTVLSCVVVLTCAVASAENWPNWRGPRGDGSSLEANVPTKWDGKSGENIAWKTPIPGIGHSSPIVWQDRLFVVSCEINKEADTSDRVLLCLDRTNGNVLWKKTVIASPLEKKHSLNSFASGTPATDGQRVYVTFLEADTASTTKTTPGNMVVAAYDFAGQQQWVVKPGRFSSVHGYCSSPVLYENAVIVNGDHDGDSYLVSLDRSTGQTNWKVPRANRTRSYVTPLIREIGGRTQMVMSGSKSVVSYDPKDGSQHWTMDGPTEQFVASLVYNGTYLFLTAGFPEHHILAIKPDGSGNVTKSHIVWRTTKNTSYVPSPIICGEHFLVASDEGIGTCYLANEGKLLWTKRLGKHYSASLITAGGLVYFLADDGKMKLVKPGEELDVVVENELGENCYASPAISQGQMFVRGESHLYCIGTGK